jgi:hypothetical protein
MRSDDTKQEANAALNTRILTAQLSGHQDIELQCPPSRIVQASNLTIPINHRLLELITHYRRHETEIRMGKIHDVLEGKPTNALFENPYVILQQVMATDGEVLKPGQTVERSRLIGARGIMLDSGDATHAVRNYALRHTVS